MLELSLSCNVVGTDEQRDGNPGFLDDGSQINEVVAIAVIECEDHRRCRDTVTLQHFDRLLQRHDSVMLLQKLDVLQEMLRRDTHPVRPIRNQMMKQNRDWKPSSAAAFPISDGY